MSDNIPFHVQEEIMKRLLVKSLVQFRSVSKAWKSLIDSSEFIAAHFVQRHTRQQHLLVSYEDQQREEKYVCYIDDDTFPQHRCLLTPLPHLSPDQITVPRLVGISCGLVCLRARDHYFETQMTFLWNPSIRKFIVVGVPAKTDGVGFAVCPVTNDPKIVSITQKFVYKPEASCKFEVMVYRLSSGNWKSLSTNLPTKLFWDLSYSVVTDGFIYWGTESRIHNCIMSFDVTNERFEVIDLPDTLARHDPCHLRVSKLRVSKLMESLVMLEYRGNKCNVWMMEHGVHRSFINLFDINTTYKIMGFGKSGVPIMKVTDYDDDETFKIVYEPNSEHNNAIGFADHFNVNSYMETLLLLDQSDCISY